MDNVTQLSTFIRHVLSDHRLKPVHLSISLALCDAWTTNNFKHPCRISRSMLMKASRIRSKATYHKVIRDLRSFGYIHYDPSYHPRNGTKVTIIASDKLKQTL